MEWYIVQTNEDFSENMNKGEMVLFIKMLSSIAMDLRDQKDMACVSQLQVWSVVLQGPPNINLDGNPGGLQASPVGPKHQWTQEVSHYQAWAFNCPARLAPSVSVSLLGPAWDHLRAPPQKKMEESL